MDSDHEIKVMALLPVMQRLEQARSCNLIYNEIKNKIHMCRSSYHVINDCIHYAFVICFRVKEPKIESEWSQVKGIGDRKQGK